MSETKRASDLPDGFYYVVDSRFPGTSDIIARAGGETWRIGDRSPFPDSEWSGSVSFFPVPSLADNDKGDTPSGKIVGMVTLKEKLFVATENGVYVKGEDDVFRLLRFYREIAEVESGE